MVKIYKGDKSMTVARSAYEEIFKMDGWRLKKETSKKEAPKKEDHKTPEDENDHEDGDNDDEDENDEEEEDGQDEDDYSYLHDKPVAEMTGEEIKIYAKMLGIEIGNKSKAEVVKQIEKKRKK